MKRDQGLEQRTKSKDFSAPDQTYTGRQRRSTRPNPTRRCRVGSDTTRFEHLGDDNPEHGSAVGGVH
jgi:hypothetical protein